LIENWRCLDRYIRMLYAKWEIIFQDLSGTVDISLD
jgi:hypothetical protein